MQLFSDIGGFDPHRRRQSLTQGIPNKYGGQVHTLVLERASRCKSCPLQPLKYMMKISELLKAPTIVSATTKSGEIDRAVADRIEDPRGYFKKSSSYYSKKRKKK